MLIAPFISILPDLTLKQLWYNLYPTPAQYIDKYKNSSELLRILGSESKFIRDISCIKSEYGQKIEIVNIEENGKLFEKRKSRIHDALKLEFIKNSSSSNNANNNNYYLGEDTTKSPLKMVDTQANPLMEYINKQNNRNYLNMSENKKIDELQSGELNSGNNKRQFLISSIFKYF